MGFLTDIKSRRLTADDFAAAVSAAAQLPVTGSGRVVTNAGPNGTSVGTDERPHPIVEVRIGVVVDEGPNGEASETDERYWVRFQGITSARNGDPVEFYDAPSEYPNDFIAAATNLAEWVDPDTGSGTHALATDGKVVVLAFLWHDDNGTERWVFDHSGTTQIAPVQPTSATANGGEYNGTVIGTGAFPSGRFAHGTTCLIRNLDEFRNSASPVSHWIDTVTATPVAHLGFYAGEVLGVPLFYIIQGTYKEPTPSPVLVDYLAITEDWRRDNTLTGTGHRGNEPVIIKMRSETSGKFRDLCFASDGRLVRASAEY